MYEYPRTAYAEVKNPTQAGGFIGEKSESEDWSK